MIPLFKVFMSPNVGEHVTNVLNSGYVGQGPKVEEFESLLKNHFETPNIVTLNSCTSALHLALHLIKNHPGDEVITTPLTCFATNAAILANQYKIRWADVDLNTCNICLDDVERKLSRNTKAIVVVHWGGYAVDLDRLKYIQQECQRLYGHTPPIIEDCAHAWGGQYKDKLIGSHGNFCAFSFQAIKTFSTADGGMLICPDEQTYKQAKLLRWFGLDRESSEDFRCKQNIKNWGFKFHMNDVNASIGITNYPHIPALLARHQTNAAYYSENLQDVPGVTLLNNKENSSYWIYTIRVKNREEFKEKMTKKGIHVSQVHARNDVYDCVKEYICKLPNLDILDKDMIAIPCGWWVSDADREYIVNMIKSFALGTI
jgi:dTDP-4-amino-4,6-dideoxygalactose transaminase